MECLPKDPYLKFNPNVLQDVRKALNLHQPGAIEQVIGNFEDWIQKQNHFTKKDFNKKYLECSIIMAKGYLEKAKKNLDTLCTMRTLMPEFFLKNDAKHEMVDLSTFITPALSPLPMEDNYRVYMAKVISTDITAAMFADYFRFVCMLCEYMKMHDYTQGIALVLDFRHVNVFDFAKVLDLIEFRKFITTLTEGYGMRVKGIYIVSESKSIDAIVAVLKQAFSKKIVSRIYVHKTVDTLYDYIPQVLLAEDFGGQQKPIKDLYYEMVELLSSKENVKYFEHMHQYKTNEAYRLTTKFKDEILGMPGSFRTLYVD